MFKFDNTHVFTGYLKQKLSTFNLPTCKIYTKEFLDHLIKNKKEDPRILESFGAITKRTASGQNKTRIDTKINYLKNNEIYNFYCDFGNDQLIGDWVPASLTLFDEHSTKAQHCLTRRLNSPGGRYDTLTHEYLGDYLRFLRDYHNINLLSMYNCFNNKIYNNINISCDLNTTSKISFNSKDANYRIYAFPVKLFENYTIAIDCNHSIELFCGLYNTVLDESDTGKDLIKKTYKKLNSTIFHQPELYDKLDVSKWNTTDELPALFDDKRITKWDIANREQDLKLFIKVPTSCRSSIVVLEGDFRRFNDYLYLPNSKGNMVYKSNHTVVNFEYEDSLNSSSFKPISKLQLLAFNTGESYPFADRLVEYLSNSAITPVDPINDNIKRAQKVMSQNGYYFKVNGLWEAKMQKILYDYIMASGPVKVQNIDNNEVLIDKRDGLHTMSGHNQKSTLYDILGYVDKDAEKWYASWKLSDHKATQKNNIGNVDIYNGLYDI